jgi:putative restriction endonuclease
MLSNINIDAEIRRCAFEFLQAATDRYGEVLPWKLLTSGMRFRNETVPLIGASGIWKPKVLETIPISITTAPPKPGRPAPYDDGIDPAGRLAYRYRGNDPQHRDNVGLREALQRGTPLIYFFGIEKGEYLATWPVYVVGDNPQSLTFRVSIDDRMVAVPGYGDQSAAVHEARRQYVTAVTVRRLHQHKFRARVLRAYRNRCAVCQLKHTELLDAAHILPDSDPRGEPTVRNGMALCKIHHAAFDRHILGIRPDLRVEIRADILIEVDGPMLRYGLQEMNGNKLYLPTSNQLKPGREFLEARYEQFKHAV